MSLIRRIFGRYTPERRAAHFLEEARMAALEHEAAAEHHHALAVMYRKREARLSQPQPQPEESND